MLARNKWQRLQGFLLFILDPVNDLHIILMQIFRVVYGDFVQNLISKIGKLPAFLAEGGNSTIAFPLVCHWLVTAQHFQGTPTRKIRPSNSCSEPAIFLQLSKVKHSKTFKTPAPCCLHQHSWYMNVHGSCHSCP